MTQGPHRKNAASIISALALALLLGVVSRPHLIAAESDNVKQQLLELTGGRQVKVVWNQGAKEEIKLFDTKSGVVQELPFTGSAPKLTPDGTRVLAVSGPDTDRTLMMFDTESKKVTKLCSGPHTFPLDIWCDPKTKREWVYVNACGAGGEFKRDWSDGQDKLFRFPIDKPDERELVWDRTKCSEFFTLSADGTHACMAPTFNNIGQMKFVFNAQGAVDQEKSSFKPIGHGCFPGIAPDNSYRLFHLVGDHMAIAMYDVDGSNQRKIKIGDLPGEKGSSWLTRWSTHPRYLTLMGPASAKARIWVGRFDETFTKVEAWVRVAPPGAQCMKSHAWIEPDPLTGTKGNKKP
jgi:WD40 repeat protein